MAELYIPHRITVQQAKVYLQLATFSTASGEIVYDTFDPDDLKAPSALASFGPATKIVIDDPFLTVNQTAGADPGDHNVKTRMGTWVVQIQAMVDVSARDYGIGLIVGDGRWLNPLRGRIVDFAIWADDDTPLVNGTGLFNGRLDLNVQDDDPMYRDVRITRVFGHADGNLNWGDLEEGTWLIGV